LSEKGSSWPTISYQKTDLADSAPATLGTITVIPVVGY